MVKNSITGWSVPPVDVSPDHGEDTDKPEDPSGGVGDIIEGIKDKLPDAGEPGKEDVPDENEPETEETTEKTIEETIEETTEVKDGIKEKAGLLIPVIIIAAAVALVIIALVIVIVLKNKKSNHSRKNAGINSEVKKPVNSAGINSDTGRLMNNAGQSGYSGYPGLRLMIEVLSGPDTGRKEILTLGDELVIGCDSTCDLVLDDEKIAGFNTKIFYRNGQVFIEDMNSPFGTILGGMRIYHANRLRSGDVILIGDTYFIVQFEGV